MSVYELLSNKHILKCFVESSKGKKQPYNCEAFPIYITLVSARIIYSAENIALFFHFAI